MKVAVKVRLKPSILDPQGKAVHNALSHLGFSGIQDVRVGKLIELKLNDDLSQKQANKMIDEAGRKLLSNPVIEDFEIEYLKD